MFSAQNIKSCKGILPPHKSGKPMPPRKTQTDSNPVSQGEGRGTDRPNPTGQTPPFTAEHTPIPTYAFHGMGLQAFT